MTEYNFRLANTCSTCKWSRFRAGDYRWGGKKQGGVCTRLQEEVVRPKKLRFFYVYSHDKMTTLGVAAYVAETAMQINREIERCTPDATRARWQKNTGRIYATWHTLRKQSRKELKMVSRKNQKAISITRKTT